MIIKLSVVLMSVLILTGCLAPTMSRTAIVKPSDSSNEEWSIFAKAENGPMSDKIIIYINDKGVINGTIGATHPRVNLSAMHEGRKIDAECSLMDSGALTLGHICVIYIDSNKITELSF